MDAMIFVGAAGVGFYHVRDWLSQSYDVEPRDFFGNLFLLRYYVDCIIPLAFMTTVSCLVARFLRPRPLLRRALVQPGAIACFGVVATALLYAAQCVVSEGVWLFVSCEGVLSACLKKAVSWGWGERLLTAYWNLPSRIGHTVTVFWLLLIISGRWRQSAAGSTGWVERWGSSGCCSVYCGGSRNTDQKIEKRVSVINVIDVKSADSDQYI